MFEKDLPGGNSTGFGGQSVSSLPLETCETINNSWGFNITDTHYKSSRDLIRLLVNDAGYGANLLLNIGPLPNGEIQTDFTDRLDSMGNWLKTKRICDLWYPFGLYETTNLGRYYGKRRQSCLLHIFKTDGDQIFREDAL